MVEMDLWNFIVTSAGRPASGFFAIIILHKANQAIQEYKCKHKKAEKNNQILDHKLF